MALLIDLKRAAKSRDGRIRSITIDDDRDHPVKWWRDDRQSSERHHSYDYANGWHAGSDDGTRYYRFNHLSRFATTTNADTPTDDTPTDDHRSLRAAHHRAGDGHHGLHHVAVGQDRLPLKAFEVVREGCSSPHGV